MRNYILRLYDQFKQEGINKDTLKDNFIYMYELVCEKTKGTRFEGKEQFIMNAIIKEFKGEARQYGNK